jgi:hypothetical protein
MNMVFSPRRSNRIAPINNVIIPPIKIPENTGQGSLNPTTNFIGDRRSPETFGRFTPPLIENDNTVESRSPSSSRSISIFRSSSMHSLLDSRRESLTTNLGFALRAEPQALQNLQSLYNSQPKFTMFNLAPSSDCSSCGNKK